MTAGSSARERRLQPVFLGVIAGIAILGGAYLARPAPLCACSPTAPPIPPSPVDGVVVFVDSSGLTAVRGFSVRLADGTTVHLEMGVLENAAEFSPSHLTEHMATGEPIRAFYRFLNEVPYVYRLEDAPIPASS
jgi:hypothetical protein